MWQIDRNLLQPGARMNARIERAVRLAKSADSVQNLVGAGNDLAPFQADEIGIGRQTADGISAEEVRTDLSDSSLVFVEEDIWPFADIFAADGLEDRLLADVFSAID